MVLVSGTYKDVLRKQFTSIEDHSKITSIKANTGVEFSGNFRYCFCYYYSTADDFTNLTSVDFTNVDTSAIDPANLCAMFYNCKKLESVKLGKNFVTDRFTDLSAMFSGCTDLKDVDTINFDTSNVTRMQGIQCFSNRKNAVQRRTNKSI